jgi:MFS family permease
MPVLDVLRTDARTVLLAAGSYVGISGLGYILLVYFVTYATRRLGLALPTTLMLIVLASLVGAPGTMWFAHLSDRIGRRRIMQWGLGALVLWSAIYFPLVDTGSIPFIALSLCGMMFLQGAYLGPQPAVFSELFAPAIRYSGASLSLTLGTIFGGALAPFIATTLYGIAGNSSLVTAYVTTLSLISWLCSLGLRETYRSEFAAGPKGPALRV